MSAITLLPPMRPIDWAVRYRAAGLQVIPSYPSSASDYKRPIGEWRHWQRNLAPDADFQRWFSNAGEHQCMGIICGEASGNLLALDFDAGRSGLANSDGWRWWQDLLDHYNGGEPLRTWTEDTGGGGVHIFVRWPSAEGNAPTGRIAGLNLDFKGQGGFVRVCPSDHASGMPYRFRPGLGPDEVDIIEAPEWLVQAIRSLVSGEGAKKVSLSHQASLGLLDAFRIDDGREELMRNLTWKHACALRSDWTAQRAFTPTLPKYPPTEIIDAYFEKAAEEYFRQVRPSGGAHKDDFSAEERLAAEGRGRRDLRDRFDRAFEKWDGRLAEAVATTGMDGPTSVAAKPTSTFRLIPFNEIRASLNSVWLIKGLMPRKGVGIIFGPPQSYKSFIMIDALIAIAAKQDVWGGAKIKNPGAVVYVCAEGAGGIRNRITAARIQHGIAEDAELPFYLIEARPRLGVEQGDKYELIASIRDQVPVGVDVACVVVDTLSQSLGGGEENGSGAQIFIGNMTDISAVFGCVACAVHHPGKGDEKRTRGHSSLDGNPDFQWLVEHQEPLRSRVSLMKMKDGDGSIAFDVGLDVLELGKDEDGEAVTTLAVSAIAKVNDAKVSARAASPRLSSGQEFLLEIMRRVALDHESGDRSARVRFRADFDGPEIDGVAEEKVRERYLREYVGAHGEQTTRAAAERAYTRARGSLIEKQIIRRFDANGRSYFADIRGCS